MGPLTLLAEDMAFLLGDARTAVPLLVACVLVVALAAMAALDERDPDA